MGGGQGLKQKFGSNVRQCRRWSGFQTAEKFKKCVSVAGGVGFKRTKLISNLRLKSVCLQIAVT